MMATTHGMAGLALGAVVAAAVPELASVALLAGLAGGVFPDLDLYRGHRRALHYPVGYAVAAAPLAVLALAWPGPATLTVATFIAAAALHAGSDVLGGGLELRPWRGTSERAVYDHVRGRWIRPWRWIRYDGAPEDVMLACGLAVPPLMLAGDHPLVLPLVGVLLAVSGTYALVRRRVPALTETAVGFVPDDLKPYVPDRFHRDPQGAKRSARGGLPDAD